MSSSTSPTVRPAFTYQYALETDAPLASIWSLYEDVSSWPQWDAGAELVTREGPFAAGSAGALKLVGQDPLAYRLVRVEPQREFVDETPFGELVVRVSHRLETLASGAVRLTHAVEIDGPPEQARAIGSIVTADFPATMQALIALAKERSRSH